MKAMKTYADVVVSILLISAVIDAYLWVAYNTLIPSIVLSVMMICQGILILGIVYLIDELDKFTNRETTFTNRKT